MKLYTLYDEVKSELNNILILKNDKIAIRTYETTIKTLEENENNIMLPEDLKLKCLGEINIETGEIKPKVEDVKITLKTLED